MSLLQERFISNWVLVTELKDLEKDETQPEIQKIATHFLGSYKFPVMMYVAFPNGTIAHQVNANEYMDETSSSLESLNSFMQNPYYAFLQAGIKNAGL